jgi:primary-amine oxidase
MATLFAHPLDPLSKVELESVMQHARNLWGIDSTYFLLTCQLAEPTKAAVLDWKPKSEFVRTVRMSFLHRPTSQVFEGVLTTTGSAISWKLIDGAKAPVVLTESALAVKAVLKDTRVRDALKLRGITDPDTQVYVETWPIGAQIPKHLDNGKRLVWTPMWFRPTPESNVYAHPINGLYAIVDLEAEEVVAIEDSGVTPIPMTPGDYRASQTGANLKLKDLQIIQMVLPVRCRAGKSIGSVGTFELVGIIVRV